MTGAPRELPALTVAGIMALKPCWTHYAVARVADEHTRDRWTALDVLELPPFVVTPSEKIWLCTHREVLPLEIFRRLSVELAASALREAELFIPELWAALDVALSSGSVIVRNLFGRYEAQLRANPSNADWALRVFIDATYSPGGRIVALTAIEFGVERSIPMLIDLTEHWLEGEDLLSPGASFAERCLIDGGRS